MTAPLPSPAFAPLDERVKATRRMHHAALAGSPLPERPRELVARSWQRVLHLGLDSSGRNLRDPLGTDRVEQLRAASPLRHVVDDLRGVLTASADAANYIVVLTDADGQILWREGSSRVRMTADRLGFAEGAEWTEERVGTNAIGTALAEAAPVELFAGEHFELEQHPWYCSAAPIHDPRTGKLLGVVDVSGPALTLHPALSALVRSSATLAEAMLRQRHHASLERLRRSSAHVLRSGPALVVDDDGWVASSVGITVRERITAPTADVPLALPGLGTCLPERLPEGWLLRPSGPHSRLVALLRGTALEVRADGEPWTVELTRRHAQVLRLLAAAGAEGLSAPQLSVALYGDTEHAVTVRAEISRLRRVVGSIIATSPYRIADDVDVRVDD
ncbi:MAG: GAF domain-containing protein [Galactobacter sp.]